MTTTRRLEDRMDESANRPTPPDPRVVLAVVVRQLGRVRVTARELEQASGGKLALRQDEVGGWVFEWREAT